MSKVRVELNSSEIKKLLKSSDVKTALESLAKKHAQGWQTDTKEMSGRVIASIYSTDQAQIDEELDGHRIVGGLL